MKKLLILCFLPIIICAQPDCQLIERTFIIANENTTSNPYVTEYSWNGLEMSWGENNYIIFNEAGDTLEHFNSSGPCEIHDTFEYDSENRLISKTRISSSSYYTGCDGYTIAYTWDELSSAYFVCTDDSNELNYTGNQQLNSNGDIINIVTYSDLDTVTVSHEYDDSGRLIYSESECTNCMFGGYYVEYTWDGLTSYWERSNSDSYGYKTYNSLGYVIEAYYYDSIWQQRTFFSEYDCINVSLIEKNNTVSLLKKIDILGRETTNKGFQLHLYDDGSVEKKYVIK